MKHKGHFITHDEHAKIFKSIGKIYILQCRNFGNSIKNEITNFFPRYNLRKINEQKPSQFNKTYFHNSENKLFPKLKERYNCDGI